MAREFTVPERSSEPIFKHEQRKDIQRREYINRLHYTDGLCKNEIVRRTGASRDFVMKWTKSKDQDCSVDRRGWPKGARRKWSEQTVERVLAIHDSLKADEEEFFHGATAVALAWRTRHAEAAPPLRTIGLMLKENGRSSGRKPTKARGAAARLAYPAQTLRTGMGRLIEADFIGPRFLAGRSHPVHFLGFCSPNPPKLRWYKRVEAQTADSIIESATIFFNEFEKPDALKVDNASASIGSMSGQRTLSRVMLFLLAQRICPVFSVPRKPFSQASIEGNNSVFSRKFWNRIDFKDSAHIDERLAAFNRSSLKYSAYETPARSNWEFRPVVVFLRQVQERDHGRERGFITILQETIPLPKAFVMLFVMAEWNLEHEILSIFLESEHGRECVKEIPFQINKTSKKKAIQSGLLSSCQ